MTNHHQSLSFSLEQSCSRRRLLLRRRIWIHKSDQTSWYCWILAEAPRIRLNRLIATPLNHSYITLWFTHQSFYYAMQLIHFVFVTCVELLRGAGGESAEERNYERGLARIHLIDTHATAFKQSTEIHKSYFQAKVAGINYSEG